ncbi:MAG: phasin family protein [Bradyrhizobiaceae bacterium]|nr:phasin family protein [Hyphomicrobiales bacterium]MBV9427308.1 phasin family protein [Bradyrhizobiaceae bacterium]
MDDNTARRTKKAAHETVEQVQETTSQATEGFREYQITILAAAQDNINGAFEYVQDIMMARSIPELIETSTRHSRRQMERVTEQARQIAAAAQKLATSSPGALPFGFNKGA